MWLWVVGGVVGAAVLFFVGDAIRVARRNRLNAGPPETPQQKASREQFLQWHASRGGCGGRGDSDPNADPAVHQPAMAD